MIHIWICRARAFEHLRSPQVNMAVSGIAWKLGQICRSYWPGAVQSLRQTAHPFVMNWASGSYIIVSTWGEAAEATSRSLIHLLSIELLNGHDADGWWDSPQAEPANSAELMAEVENSLVEISGPLGRIPDSAKQEHLGLYISSALKLRWLRTHTDQSILWGELMGRLRWLRDQVSGGPAFSESALLSDVLHASFQPANTWEEMASEQDEENRVSNLIKNPPAVETSEGELIAWISQAINVMDTPSLSELLEPLKDRLLALDTAVLQNSDRRLRRRISVLQKSFATEQAPDESPESEDEPSAIPAMSEIERLVSAILPVTAGRRVLFVSNRADNTLKSRLLELLKFSSIDWCDSSQHNRVVNHCRSIENGAYDLVLSATGFQLHRTEIVLAQATALAKIPLVRVNRGRPMACVRAVARHYGIRAPA